MSIHTNIWDSYEYICENMYVIKVKEGLHRESREHSEGRRDKEGQLSRAQ